MRCLLLLALLPGCLAETLTPELLLLGKVKAKVVQNLTRLPNYTCSETVERTQKLPSARKAQTRDTIRLEVAMVEGHEMYGWPDSNRIAESELSALVGGTIGNGDFGLLTKSIFLAPGTIFTFMGQENLEGHVAVRWDYRVPLLSSGYRIRVPPNEAVVAYHGSVWIDKDSLDLLSLTLAADDIPEVLGLQACTKRIEYQRSRIGSEEFLLPNSSELVMVEFNGIESHNRTNFHDCRQFSGESVLSFADPAPETSPVSAVPAEPIDLPDNFSAELSLLTPIDAATAAVGDPVRVKLEDNIKFNHKLLVPRGAILSGHISQLHHEPGSYRLGFAFQSIDLASRHGDLSGRENSLQAVSQSGPSPQSGSRSAEPPLHPLVFEANRTHLPKGLLLYLQSRLVKSEKQ